jgi:hypothetical protein
MDILLAFCDLVVTTAWNGAEFTTKLLLGSLLAFFVTTIALNGLPEPLPWHSWASHYDFSFDFLLPQGGITGRYGNSLTPRSEYRAVMNILLRTTRSRLSKREALHMVDTILMESRKAGLDPALVAAVIKHESAFNREAVSQAGAIGLMQIMPATGRYLCSVQQLPWGGTRRLCSPALNVQLGTSYLKQLINRFSGDLTHALIAYNWGPANLERSLKSHGGIPASSRRYARNILQELESARIGGTLTATPRESEDDNLIF